MINTTAGENVSKPDELVENDEWQDKTQQHDDFDQENDIL